MRSWILFGFGFVAAVAVLTLLHYSVLRLPYFWDEAGYYIPAAVDFYRHGLLIPQTTMPTGHPPLLSVYLGLAWWLLGFSPLVTRIAMIVLATGTLAALYALGRTVARGEIAAWACILLALSPVFFAQSSLAHLDLPVAFGTTAATLALIRRRLAWFAVLASLAVLTKETAVVFLPVVWIYAWRIRKELKPSAAAWLTLPLAPLVVWTLYYHHATGFWTGNPSYLKYNLYSTIEPSRILVTLMRRLYQILVAGFNWLLVGAAILGYRAAKKLSKAGADSAGFTSLSLWQSATRKDFFFLSAGLTVAYTGMLSVVGGAVLPRYLLPIFPCFYLAILLLVDRLPRLAMRSILVVAAACFIAAWFINPPYPFPYEDNLAYADFVHLHQQAASFLSRQPNEPRILTAWPATGELTEPELGYVKRPLRVVDLEGFTPQDFSQVSPRDFDLLYLYSRKWNPPDNWLRRFLWADNALEYAPPERATTLAREFHLKLLASFCERGQWVKIYSRQAKAKPADNK